MPRTRRKKSTTVRLFSLLRLGFRIGERLAPGLSGRTVARLWFRLPAPAAKRRRSRLPAGGYPIEFDSDGTTVRGYDWGRGRLVYLQHGWGGCIGDFDNLAASLVANGFRVIAVDAPSHGNSGTGPYGARESSPLHSAAALSTAIDKFGEPHAVVAHSLGCLSSVIALRDRRAIPRVVLIAPFVGGATFTDLFAKQLRAGPRTLDRFVTIVESRVGKPLNYFDIVTSGLGSPTLVVHDRNDRSTPFAHGRLLADSWPDTQLYPTESLGHMRILRNPSVIGEIMAYLDSRGTPPAPGTKPAENA